MQTVMEQIILEISKTPIVEVSSVIFVITFGLIIISWINEPVSKFAELITKKIGGK